MSAELAARRTAAAAVLAEFRRWDRGEITPGGWQQWSFRLASELEQLLQVSGDKAATFVRPDGSASLSHQDMLSVLGAIATAAEYLEYAASLTCAACCAHPAELCDKHAADLDAAAAYRAVAIRLDIPGA